MIPHRMLTNEIYGNGLKDRVIACRKRLRHSRATHPGIGNVGSVGVNDDAEELFPETVPSVAEFSDHAAGNLPECSAISTPVVRLECRPAFSVEQAPEGESMLLVGEQRVGIT
jgi:hypothetical protein